MKWSAAKSISRLSKNKKSAFWEGAVSHKSHVVKALAKSISKMMAVKIGRTISMT